ncbi:AraC family transcriptional regulator [Nocardia cyriacigeorgica]|uniref:AraC family transcriptional regulator n=1 Tax=Nocardia cyriacigeorgica TaxID=135487 RepID=UPI002805F443|nr:helix-turn-helix transcriptional regulator [Nocardia cyriacigeorgica]
MSQDGQPVVMPAAPGATAMVLGGGALPRGHWFPLHQHPQHQIAWAAGGVLTVETAGGRWILPTTRALWIPAGTAHRTGTAEGADMRGIFIEPDRCPLAFSAPSMLRVTRLIRELFEHLSAATIEPPRRARAEATVFDLLEPVAVIPVGATPPSDPRAADVAAALLRDPADPRTLDEFATAVATSARTLARAFTAETGMTFGQWRTQVRLAASLPLLAEGLPVSRVAGRVGYGTTSAYVAAFRRTVGVSPGRYFAE